MAKLAFVILSTCFSLNMAFAVESPLIYMHPCYAQLRPEIELSKETLKAMHDTLLAGKSANYSVVMNTAVNEQGLATATQVTAKSDIPELDGVAEDISKVAAIQCKGIADRKFRETYQFDLDYEPGEKSGTVIAKPYYSRNSEPLSLIDAPLTKRLAAGICGVSKYSDETGIAEEVECGFDGYCTIVGKLRQPNFPRRQLGLRRVGKVTIKISVNPNGIIEGTEAILSSGNASFDRAAQNAAALTQFTCTGSKPLREYSVTYEFGY